MWNLRRWLLAGALALAASVGAALGAELVAGDPGSLLPSEPPALLGPITEGGRTGWNCPPERAARSRDAVAGGLPER
ncbi:MAG TPA: hypothetical protein VMA36_10645 [Candidatus Limnocylindria bacterium]|jgi:hypothetical protein|nr:hypothetical protein [Candidatus Limnocylindria bacterium]